MQKLMIKSLKAQSAQKGPIFCSIFAIFLRHWPWLIVCILHSKNERYYCKLGYMKFKPFNKKELWFGLNSNFEFSSQLYSIKPHNHDLYLQRGKNLSGQFLIFPLNYNWYNRKHGRIHLFINYNNNLIII